MNTVITSKEEILKGALEFVSKNSLALLNMRSLAAFLQISVGSIYHYFTSKDQLVQASVESVFKDIFSSQKTPEAGFIPYLHFLYEALKEGERKYPGFFTSHSFVFETKNLKEAQEKKSHSRNAVKEKMKEALNKDRQVRKDAFNTLDEEAFIDLTFDSLLYSYLEKKDEMKALEEMVRRVIYQKENE